MENISNYYTADALEKRISERRLYAIVDAIAHDDVAGFAAELIDKGEGSAIPDLNASGLVTEDSVPYVVRMSDRFWRFLTNEIWPQNNKDAGKPSWGFFFETSDQDLNFTALVEHWRAWYFVRLPQRLSPHNPHEDIRAVFRYFDPRLTDAFLEAANAMEAAAFFGPLSHLLLPQSDGCARIYRAPILSDEPQASSVRLRREFTMRKAHIEALEIRRLEQRLPEFLAYLEKHFEDDFQRRQINDRQQFVRAGLQQATKYSFLSERACVGWLSLQLLHGLEFAKEQAWAINILNDKQHTIGTEDRVDRLIGTGFDRARTSDNTGSTQQQGTPS